jgi:hypothetical protein
MISWKQNNCKVVDRNEWYNFGADFSPSEIILTDVRTYIKYLDILTIWNEKKIQL